jgi:hypothetical protein
MEFNDRKSRFSLGYITAVAAHAGYQVLGTRIDKDSVDGVLMGEEGRRPRVEFQAKATARDVLRVDHLAFPLPIKNYDDLRADVITPRLLVVVVLSDGEGDWLAHSEEELRLRRCGYWLSLAGQAEVPNTSSVTVRVPRTQVFDTEQLRAVMQRAEGGEAL